MKINITEKGIKELEKDPFDQRANIDQFTRNLLNFIKIKERNNLEEFSELGVEIDTKTSLLILSKLNLIIIEYDKKRIYSIKEAYSMQPKKIVIGEEFFINSNLVSTKLDKIELKLITLNMQTDPENRYIGYDKEGRELFSVLSNSVNVEYNYE